MSAQTPASVDRPLRVGVLEDNFPFSFRGPDGEMTGFAYELVAGIEELMGLKFVRIEGTTNEINAAFEAGQLDLLQSYAPSPQREVSTNFSAPYLTMGMQIFGRKNGPAFKSLADLKDRKVLVHPGSLGEQLLRDSGLGSSVTPVASVRDALIRLNHGEGEAALATRLTGLATAHHLGLTQLEVLDVTIGGPEIRYCLAVHQGDQVLLDRINEGMALMRTTGQFETLYQKWFGFVQPRGYTGEQVLQAVAIGLTLALVVAFWAMVRQRSLSQKLLGQTEALRSSERHFRATFDDAPTGMCLTGPNGQFLMVNRALCRLLGYPAPTLLAMTFAEITHPDDLPSSQAVVQRLLNGTLGATDFEKRYIRQDGQIVWTSVRICLVRGLQGEPLHFITHVVDISAGKQAVESVQALSQRLTWATDAANIGIWDWEVALDRWFATPTYFTMLGYDPEEGFSDRKLWIERVHPHERDAVSAKINAVLAGDDAPYRYEARIRHADGNYRWIMVVGRVVERDSRGKVKRMMGVRVDISKLKQAEDAVRANEMRFRAMFEQAPLGIAEGEIHSAGFVTVNQRYADLLGYTRKELQRLTFADFTHPEDLAKDMAEFQKLADGKIQSYALDKRYIRKDGEVIWVNLTVSSLSPTEGKPQRCIAIIDDLTARKQSEAELRRSEQALQRSQEIAQVGSWSWEIEPNVVTWSNEVYRIYGHTPDTFDHTLEGVARCVHPEDAPKRRQAYEGILSGRPFKPFNYRVVRPSGEIRIIHNYSAEVEWDQAGHPVRVRGALQDITEREQVAEHLRSSLQEKNALLNEVHHRVKNNMQVISSLLRLKSNALSDPETKIVLQEMQNRIRSMALVHETLYTSGNFAVVDLQIYLRKVATELFRSQNHAPERVRLNLELGAGSVGLDEAVCCGFIVNELLTNSLKYAFPHLQRGELRVGCRQGDRGQLSLWVHDDGVGLPEKERLRNGRSLGLQLVSDLTRQLRGTLEIDAGPGTRFTIEFTPKIVDQDPNPSDSADQKPSAPEV